MQINNFAIVRLNKTMETKQTSKIYYKSDSTEWEKIDDYIDRQIVGYDESVMMVNVRFKKGGIGYKHKHPHIQVTYVAEGKFEVNIGEDISILKKGDSFFVPSNVLHGVECLEDGVLVDVFSPFREDFIK